MRGILKPIYKFEKTHVTNEFGEVYSLDKIVPARGGKTRIIKGKKLKAYKNNRGYLYYWLCVKRPNYKVKLQHRLIYEYFNGPIPEGLVINHLDSNPLNNSIDNLEVVTQKQNVFHQYFLSTKINKNMKLTQDRVLQIFNLAHTGLFNYIDIANQYEINPTHVGKIKRKEVWTHLWK